MMEALSSFVLQSPVLWILLVAVAAAVSGLGVKTLPLLSSVDEAGRLKSVDGLRGFLALSVFVHHVVVNRAYRSSGEWKEPSSFFQNEFGQIGVALFFMITAFLFFGRVKNSQRIDWRRLYLDRIFRLAPLYLFAVACLAAIAFAGTGFQLKDTIPRLAKSIANWVFFTMKSAPDINGYERTSLIVASVTWTLRYEWMFYLSLPLLAFLFSRHRRDVSTRIALAFCLVLIAGVLASAFRPNPFRALAFLGGIAACFWVENERLRSLAKGPIAAAVALLCLSYPLFFLRSAYSPPAFLALSVFFCVVASGNTLFGILSAKPFLWLGEISYSLYLLHGLAVTLLLRLMPIGDSAQAYLAWSCAACAVLVVLCSASYRFIEKPGIRFGKSLHRSLGEPRPKQ